MYGAEECGLPVAALSGEKEAVFSIILAEPRGNVAQLVVEHLTLLDSTAAIFHFGCDCAKEVF